MKQRGAGGKDLRPMIKLVDAKGKDLCLQGTQLPAHYFLPHGAIVTLEDGAQVSVGDVVARIPQESPVKLEILPVVCPALLICLKLENPKMRLS